MALMANDACGSPVPFQMTFPWTFFDGKLFHSKLIKATQARNLVELCDGRVEMAYQVERIRDIIMTGGTSPPKPHPGHPGHPGHFNPGFKFNQHPKPKTFQKKKANSKHKDKVWFTLKLEDSAIAC